MKETFSINDVAMITSLSTRTIRTYISTGFLNGEKVNGAWQFTPEQVEAFTQNRTVRPSIKAKKNAIVFDFLGTKPEKQDKMCTILHIASKEAAKASMFFCEKINACTPEAELQFASDPQGSGARIIISGSTKDVMELLEAYYNQ